MIERSVPTASMVAWAPEDRWSPMTMAADDAPHGPGQLGGRDDVGGAEAAGLALLVRVAGADHDVGIGDVADEAGDGGEAHRAGPEDGDDRRSAACTEAERPASRAAWMPPASGSTSTARSSGTSSAEAVELATRGRRTGCDQPPPVEQQNPVWMPGSRSPVARWA